MAICSPPLAPVVGFHEPPGRRRYHQRCSRGLTRLSHAASIEFFGNLAGPLRGSYARDYGDGVGMAVDLRHPHVPVELMHLSS